MVTVRCLIMGKEVKLDVWKERGSIFISFGGKPDVHMVAKGEVIIGIKGNKVINLEVLLDDEGTKMLKELLK